MTGTALFPKKRDIPNGTEIDEKDENICGNSEMRGM